jgi:chromosome partitioning protein
MINYKGGVGKTTLTVNLAADLARYHEKKVLLVDTDPQTNATSYVMNPEKRYDPQCRHKNLTLARVFKECGKRNKSYKDIRHLIVESVVEKDGKKVLPNLDLLPSDPLLIRAERWLTETNNPYAILKRELDSLRDDYDYVLLDCAPNLYALTKNAIVVSDYYIIPTIPDYLSNIGLNILVKEIQDFSEDMKELKPKSIKLKGVIFSKFKTVSTRYQQGWIDDLSGRLAKEGIPNVGIPPGQVKPFETIIRDLLPASEAADFSLPLCVFDPTSSSAQDFRDLTKEFVDRI